MSINLAISIDFTKGLLLINGVSFPTPTLPVLLQILSGNLTPQQLIPGVISLPPNKVIEVTIPGQDGPPHPFHLHGVSTLRLSIHGLLIVYFSTPSMSSGVQAAVPTTM